MNELRLKNFLGIDFGVSPEYAKRKLLSKPECIYDPKNSSEEILCFKGLTFAGQKTTSIMLLFLNKKFHKATVHIKPKPGAAPIQDYIEIQKKINSKYSIANGNFEVYEKNNGYTKTDISLEKSSFSNHWKIPDTYGVSENLISLKIDNDTIIVNYEKGNLINQYPIYENSENARTTCFFLVSFILFLYLFTI